MSKIRTVSTSLRRVAAWAAALLLAPLAGCAQLNDPWSDSSKLIDADMSTPSTQGYSGQPEFGRPIRRSYEAGEVAYANTAVTHWPLWFEDPFEDKGNRYVPVDDQDAPDNEFAVNWVDYLHLGYGPGRLLLNVAGWPISACVTPPGMLMESDGRLSKGLLGYDHDAKRSDPATREAPDVSSIDRKPFREDLEPASSDSSEDLAIETSAAEPQPAQ